MSNHMPRDIVDILRYDAGSRPGGICEAAAKEIERLRADNAALRALLAECSSADPDDDERDDSPYCDCGNIPGEEEDAFNRCSACGKRLDP